MSATRGDVALSVTAVDTLAFVSNDGGLDWVQSAQLGAMPGSLNVLACPTTRLCLADAQSYVLRSTDGGQTWNPVSR